MPEKDHLEMEVARIETDVLPIAKAAMAYEIVDQSTMEGGVNFLGKVKEAYDRVEKTRKFFTGPLLELKKTYDSKFKPTLDELELCEKELKQKMVDYRQTLVTSTEPPKTTKTADAKATFVKKWKFEITDETLVPRDYLCVDEKKIGKVVDAGMRNIPGVKVYEVEEVRSGYSG